MKKMVQWSVFLFLVMAAPAVHAHPASHMDLTFDPATRMLVVVITHQVSSPDRHYIDKVDVAVNGRNVIAHLLSRQDDNIRQTVTYRVPDIREGDVISVDAHCNKGGDLKKELR